jgi:hypothetical protein
MAIATIVFDFGNVIGFFDHRRAARKLCAQTGVPAENFRALLRDSALEDAYESSLLAIYGRRLTWCQPADDRHDHCLGAGAAGAVPIPADAW